MRLHVSDLLVQNASALTRVRQDGISLRQELVTANALETLFTPDLEKKEKKDTVSKQFNRCFYLKQCILGTISMGLSLFLVGINAATFWLFWSNNEYCNIYGLALLLPLQAVLLLIDN